MLCFVLLCGRMSSLHYVGIIFSLYLLPLPPLNRDSLDMRGYGRAPVALPMICPRQHNNDKPHRYIVQMNWLMDPGCLASSVMSPVERQSDSWYRFLFLSLLLFSCWVIRSLFTFSLWSVDSWGGYTVYLLLANWKGTHNSKLCHKIDSGTLPLYWGSDLFPDIVWRFQ